MIFREKRRKRTVSLLISLLMILSLIGCSGKEESTHIAGDTSTSKEASLSDAEFVEHDTDMEDTISDYSEENASLIGDKDSQESVSETSVESVSAESEKEVENTPVILDENNESIVEEDNSAGTASEVITAESNNISYEGKNDGLTSTMRNSINMLNYMTSLTRKINVGKGNQLFLESAYNSFDNLFPNAVDIKTQAQITSLMDTIQGYRMISVKRDRLEYIYEQNRAQALRQAIPNPIGLLSAVQSGNLLRVAASVLYMAVDSATSYQAAISQADLEFIKEGWELDDAEADELHESTKDALNYMYDMVRDYDIPGDYALNEDAVDSFVLWSGKPNSQLERKISWFETNQSTYSQFGPYWLEMAKNYYNYKDYSKCLEAVKQYEVISTRIFRKDIDYATVLPMAIISAKETMNTDDYVKCASEYCASIRKNTGDKDWTLRYYTAQVFLDLYSLTQDEYYLSEAYKISRENVVVLVDEQKELNTKYLADLKEVKAEKDATKREKEEVKKHNKLIKNERKLAVPPVSEALYLNCDLLFALAKVRNIDDAEKRKIEAILHENGERIFLTNSLDDQFWFDNKPERLNVDSIEVSYDGDTFTIPASCITDRSTIVVTITGHGRIKLDDWIVSEVKRPKGSKDCSEFTVTFKSKKGEKYKYRSGENVSIVVTPVKETLKEHLDFSFDVVATKKMFIFDDIEFERTTK